MEFEDKQREEEIFKKIRVDYVAGVGSYRLLSEKYGVSVNKIEKRAKKEHWTELKRQCDGKAAAEIVNKTALTIAKQRKRIFGGTDKIYEKWEKCLNNTADDDYKRLNSLAVTLKIIRELLETHTEQDKKEQKARIKALEKATSPEEKNDITVTVVSGSEYGK